MLTILILGWVLSVVLALLLRRSWQRERRVMQAIYEGTVLKHGENLSVTGGVRRIRIANCQLDELHIHSNIIANAVISGNVFQRGVKNNNLFQDLGS